MLMVPLHNGQQVLAVLQGQLADVHQALLIVGPQDGTPVAGHRGLFALQSGIEAGIPQIGHRQRGHLHCRPPHTNRLLSGSFHLVQLPLPLPLLQRSAGVQPLPPPSLCSICAGSRTSRKNCSPSWQNTLIKKCLHNDILCKYIATTITPTQG